MNTFLTKISQLPSIQKVLFLSSQGEVLFSDAGKDEGEADRQVSLWQAIIGALRSPIEAELFFEHGGYYLHYTEVGYIIIGMNGFGHLPNLKAACAQLQAKLSDPTICKKVLLRMLQDAEEAMKPQFVLALLPYADKEIAEKLIALLGQSPPPNVHVGIKLLGNICQVLGRCRSSAALRALQKIVQAHDSGRTVLNDELKTAVQVAIAQLELVLPPATGTAASDQDLNGGYELPSVQPKDRSPRSSSPAAEKNHAAPQVPQELKIKDLLQRGKKGEAISLMLEQIEVCSQKKQFDMAEQLREWLIQVDSTSLREIIRAAEIIEEQKNASITDEYRAVWSKLAGELSMDEFSSLYHALVHKQYQNGDIVVEQGQFISTLFFVNSGRVQLFSAGHGGEYVLKTIETGEIFGAETFFDISIWTMSARSLGADISLLSWDRLLKLKENTPALRTKLMDYCSRYKLKYLSFDKVGTTRRRFERVKVSGNVAVSLSQKMGEESFFGTKGNLLDISRGGLAFSVRFSRKKNAIALLGQVVNVTVRTDLSPNPVQRNGVVKAVHCHDFVGNDYTIHMEFQETLSSAEVSQAVGRNR